MASGNVVDGVFLENNRLHIDCRGPQNQFVAISAEKGPSRFHGGADFTRLIGGRYADLSIEDGVRDVKLLGIAVRRIADRGLRTQRLGCHDIAADLPMPDHDGAPAARRDGRHRPRGPVGQCGWRRDARRIHARH